MSKKKFNPLQARQDAQTFIVGYLKNKEIKLPPMDEDKYKAAMDSVTQAMALAWADGFWKGRES